MLIISSSIAVALFAALMYCLLAPAGDDAPLTRADAYDIDADLAAYLFDGGSSVRAQRADLGRCIECGDRAYADTLLCVDCSGEDEREDNGVADCDRCGYRCNDTCDLPPVDAGVRPPHDLTCTCTDCQREQAAIGAGFGGPQTSATMICRDCARTYSGCDCIPF